MKISSLKWGPENGKPILAFHGFPGSVHDVTAFGLWAEKYGSRLFAFDRPGYGETDYGFKKDITLFYEEILKQIPENEKITVIGVSGGGPYATDFVARYSHRIEKLILVCAVAGLKNAESFNSFPFAARTGLRVFSKMNPKLQQSLFRLIRKMRGAPEKFHDKFVMSLPFIDQKTFEDDRVRQAMKSSFARAAAQDLLGAVADLNFYLNWEPPQNFPKEIRTYIFHGTLDTIVPFVSSKIFREHIPSAKFQSWEEGHFSLPVKRLEEIMKIASEEI